MKEIDTLSSELLFDIQKAFYDERGRGARYRLTIIGVDYMKSLRPDCFASVDSVRKALLELEMVEGIELTEDEVSVSAKVKGCYFRKVRDRFIKAEMEVLSCPIANLIMHAMEGKSGLSPELMPVTAEGGVCLFGLAKLGTSDIVSG